MREQPSMTREYDRDIQAAREQGRQEMLIEIVLFLRRDDKSVAAAKVQAEFGGSDAERGEGMTQEEKQRAEVERLLDWLYYIEQTTSDVNVLAAVELANKGESAEFEGDEG